MFAESELVKKPNAKIQYTKEQIEQLIKCSHPETGPRYFIENFVYIQHPTKGRMLLHLYDFQKRLIDAFNGYVYSCHLISRQMGKTTCAAAYLLWYAMFMPDSTILITAHKYSGSQEIMQRIRFAYENIPDYIRCGVVSYNKGSLDFDNGSRILSSTTTETTGRGLSLSLLYADEFAYVPNRIAREFWTSLSPTLSTGGKCIITSTPNSDDDQFAEIWHRANKTIDEYGNETELGQNGFKAVSALWYEHPDRDEEWERKERAQLGEERFLREHCCQFIVFSETLINQMKLATLEGIQPIKKTGQVRWYKKIEKNKTYLLSLDPSLGTGSDNAAIQVFELPTFIQVAEWQHNKTPIEGQMRVVMDVLKEIHNTLYPNKDYTHSGDNIYWTVESNTLGEAALLVIRDTGEENFPGTFLSDKVGKRKGYCTTNKVKLQACSKLKDMVEKDKITLHSKNLISELKNFVAKSNTFEGKDGEKDDLVSALLLIIRMAQYISKWDTTTSGVLSGSILHEQESRVDPMPMLVL